MMALVYVLAAVGGICVTSFLAVLVLVVSESRSER